MERTVLKASEGMILTDGAGTYGKVIYLAGDRCGEEFFEITQADYEAMLKEEAERGE